MRFLKSKKKLLHEASRQDIALIDEKTALFKQLEEDLEAIDDRISKHRQKIDLLENCPDGELTIRRFLQIFFMIHRIHHIQWSYGYKFWFLPVGYFDDYGFARTGSRAKWYHNCTLTGIY